MGDKVTLSGAGIEKAAPLFIGGTDGNRFQLWAKRDDKADGKPWICDAAGSHSARAA